MLHGLFTPCTYPEEMGRTLELIVKAWLLYSPHKLPNIDWTKAAAEADEEYSKGCQLAHGAQDTTAAVYQTHDRPGQETQVTGPAEVALAGGVAPATAREAQSRTSSAYKEEEVNDRGRKRHKSKSAKRRRRRSRRSSNHRRRATRSPDAPVLRRDSNSDVSHERKRHKLAPRQGAAERSTSPISPGGAARSAAEPRCLHHTLPAVQSEHQQPRDRARNGADVEGMSVAPSDDEEIPRVDGTNGGVVAVPFQDEAALALTVGQSASTVMPTAQLSSQQSAVDVVPNLALLSPEPVANDANPSKSMIGVAAPCLAPVVQASVATPSGPSPPAHSIQSAHAAPVVGTAGLSSMQGATRAAGEADIRCGPVASATGQLGSMMCNPMHQSLPLTPSARLPRPPLPSHGAYGRETRRPGQTKPARFDKFAAQREADPPLDVGDINREQMHPDFVLPGGTYATEFSYFGDGVTREDKLWRWWRGPCARSGVYVNLVYWGTKYQHLINAEGDQGSLPVPAVLTLAGPSIN